MWPYWVAAVWVVAACSAASAAFLAATAVPQPELHSIVFAVTFAALRVGLWSAAAHNRLAPTRDRNVDQPDLSLALIVAPIGLVSVLAGQILGDGGVLLSLAGLLPMLCVVSEWWRLRIA